MKYWEVLRSLDSGSYAAKLPHWKNKFIMKTSWDSTQIDVENFVKFIVLVDKDNEKAGPFYAHACDINSDEWEVTKVETGRQSVSKLKPWGDYDSRERD